MPTYQERQQANAVKTKAAYEGRVAELPEVIDTLGRMTENEEAQSLATSLQKTLDGLPVKISEIDDFIRDLED